jgi:hypothetical protein
VIVMIVTIVKHRQRYIEDLPESNEVHELAALQALHGYTGLLYDRDDFQSHALIADVEVRKSLAPFDDTRPAFWVRLSLGLETHHILCWTIMDLFETFDLLKLLPNTIER